MIKTVDVPPGRTVFGWLSEQYKLKEASQDVKSPLAPGDILDLPLSISVDRLAVNVARLIAEFGLHGFVSKDYAETAPDYANQSLTYNPDSNTPPERSTLGSERLTRAQHYYATPQTIQSIGEVRGSYYDSYGFRVATPGAVKHLSELLGLLKRSQVRSRLSVIRGNRPDPSGFAWGWHRDESVFENLRINIPLTNCPQYILQISRSMDFPSRPGAHIVDYQAKPGRMYSWDTHLPHRACAVDVPAVDRTSIVLGISPWFDYDPVQDGWFPNEFFGKKHPHQMLLDGDVL